MIKRLVTPISDGYVYNKMHNYSELLLTAIMKSERIDKDSTAFFEDVVLAIKHSKAPSYVIKILTSKKTHLIYPPEPLPRPVKVFAAKDKKNKGKSGIEVFIDASNIIKTDPDNHRYSVKADVLLAYLLSAKHNMLYYHNMYPTSVSSKEVYLCTKAFAKLLTHIIDYLGNISIIPENREKMMYIASKYFLINILGLDPEDKNISNIAAASSKITEQQVRIFDLRVTNEDIHSLAGLVDTIKDVFKLNRLTVGLLLEKWMYLFGNGTVLSVEFLPSFLTMITDAYVGVYLNNQKSIEKILNKDLAELGKMLIYSNSEKIAGK